VSARAEQVQEAAATRERQVEQARACHDWLEANENGRTHHGYGLCVKVRDCWCTCEPEDRFDWSNFRCTCGYELVREGFWEDAGHIASEHDFADANSAGRNSGWLVVNPQPHMDDWWEDEQHEWLERLAAFALDIEELLTGYREAWARGEHVSGDKLADILADIHGDSSELES
jgi:hypothetical protein